MESIKKARTGVILGIKQAEIHERILKSLDPNDVLIEVQACNLCTSEFGVWSGARTNRPFPFIFGHEWAGKVLKVGTRVKTVKQNDIVAGSYGYDVYSEEAKAGRTSESDGVRPYDVPTKDGYYGRYEGCADYLVMPQESLFKMNEEITSSELGFLEPVSTVVAGLKRLHLSGNETIVVIGAGTMGILNALVARQRGLNVVITEFLPKKIELARKMGFEVVDGNEDDPVKKVKEITDGKGVDVAIVAVGSTKANEQSSQMIKKFNGSILLFAAGYPAPKIGIDANEVHYRKISIFGAFSADYKDFKEAARLLNERKIDVSNLIDETYSFDELQEAFEASTKLGQYRVSVVMK